MSLLPDPNQNWSHSTCSKEKMLHALGNETITAIEVDIVMGTDISSSVSGEDNKENLEKEKALVPILAHPPERSSDLNVRTFLSMVSSSSNDDEGKDSSSSYRKLLKHIKLDFKEIGVIEPTLKAIQEYNILYCGKQHSTSKSPSVFLNIDVLPGPGLRNQKARVDAQEFFDLCLKEPSFAENKFMYSLGWACDPRTFSGYSDDDIESMLKIIQDYNLVERSSGIVLAVNARVLQKNMKPFVKILSSIPSSQLLVWTATGEPPISPHCKQNTQLYFQQADFGDRVGFDCSMASSSFHGLVFDLAMTLATVYFNVASK